MQEPMNRHEDEEEAVLCQCMEDNTPQELSLLKTVDDDEEEEDEEGRGQGFKMTLRELHQHRRTCSFYTCVSSRPCLVCVYLVLLMTMLCAFISLVVVGVLVATPYAKAAHFLHTRCAYLRTTWLPEEEQCSCGKGCSSHYPCLLITVNVTVENGDVVQAILTEDESNLGLKVRKLPES
jgi:hypothetical protein